MKTFTLIILTLVSGQTREFVTADPDLCWLLGVLETEQSLWVEDTDLPRQNPASFECRCALVDEVQQASIYP